jgi:hypothetical protein
MIEYTYNARNLSVKVKSPDTMATHFRIGALNTFYSNPGTEIPLQHAADLSYCLMIRADDTAARYQSREDAIRYLSEEIVTHCESWILRAPREIVQPILRHARYEHSAFPQMNLIAREMITDYHEDFYFHDLYALGLQLEENNCTDFYWGVRSHGTHISFPGSTIGLQSLWEYSDRVFHWDNDDGNLVELVRTFAKR